jgi:EamA-like transporter family.
VATLVMLLLSIPVLRGLSLHEILMGGAIGFCIYMSYSLQAHGMLTISSSKSAFITAFYVPIVPLLQWLILRRPPRFMSWLGIFCAFGGLLLLAGPEGSTIGLGWGEFLTLLGALVVAVEIILIGKFALNVNPSAGYNCTIGVYLNFGICISTCGWRNNSFF